MAVFTLTVDTPNGFNTDLFFTGLLPVKWNFNGTSGTTSGSTSFFLLNDEAVVSGVRYNLAVTGTELDVGFYRGVLGNITSANLTRTPSGGSEEQLAHLTIALGNGTGAAGGVLIPGLLALTPDVLLRAAASDTNGAQLNVIGAAGNDRITGGGYKDQLFGNNGNDLLDSKASADLLNGGAGNDVLLAGSGNDLLFGGLGIDKLTGGAGLDTFGFDKAPALANRDIIYDFSHKDDRIALENEFFKGLSEGVLSADAFRVGSHALDASDRIIYNKVTGGLYYDKDGSGAAAQVQFATLIGSPDDVTRGDFLII